MAKRKQIPTVAIDMLVGNMHCSTPVAEVRAAIEKRCKKQPWATPARVKACGDYAVKSHERNVKLYCAVMRGRF